MSEVETLTREGVLETIRAHLAARDVDPAAVTEPASFTTDLDLDSLTLQTLAQELEDTYGVQIGPADAAAMHTVGMTVDFVIGARGAGTVS